MRRWWLVLLAVVTMHGACAYAQSVDHPRKHRHHHHHKVKGVPSVPSSVPAVVAAPASSGPPSVAGLQALPAGWTVVGGGKPVVTQNVAGGGLVPSPSPSAGVDGLWLPLGERTPIAVFREGAQGVIVVHGEHHLDTLGSLDAGGFAPVRSHVLPGVTIITFTLPEGLLVGVKPQGAGWVISAASITQAEMSFGRWGQGISFVPPEQDAGLESVQIDDPLSGRRLLVGMVRAGHVSSERIIRGDGYAVRPSLIGLVVAADEDTLELRTLAGRFVLDRLGASAEPLFAMRDLPDTGASLSAVSFGQGAPDQLKNAVRDAWFAVSASSPGERLNARIHLAQNTARLGQGAQTDQILRTIIRDEPEAAGRSDVRRLQQVASVLLGRARDDALMSDGGTAPEDQFWRGMMRTLPEDPRLGERDVPGRLRDLHEQEQTARMIAAGLPSLMSYSSPLQAALRGPAALWVARYGDAAAQKVLDVVPKAPDTVLAYAVRDMRQNTAQADRELDILAHNPSSHLWPEARLLQIQRAVAAKHMSQVEAVQQLDQLMPAFRMAGVGEAAQKTLLEARLQSGKMGDALMAFLQEKHGVFWGDDEATLRRIANGMVGQLPTGVERRAAEAGLLRRVLRQYDTMSQETQHVFRRALAERYRYLGLPFDERAVLRLISGDENSQEHRQRLVRVVDLDLAIGDVEVAERDLSAIPEPDVASVTASDIVCLRARLLAAQHRVTNALVVLQPYTDPQATALQAELAETAREWKIAEEARFRQLNDVAFPHGGAAALNDAQAAIVLHAAGDASHAQDVTAQEQLWRQYRMAMMRTPAAGFFRIVTGHAVE